MIVKQKRATELLNIELSRISAALAVAESFTEQNGAAGKAMKQARDACSKAFDHLQTISLHASMI